MARRKKNASVDIAAQIAEKQAEAEGILADMEDLKEGIANAKLALKEKKKALKATQKELDRLEVMKEKENQEKAEKEKRSILQAKIKEMVKNGTSYEDILVKLD